MQDEPNNRSEQLTVKRLGEGGRGRTDWERIDHQSDDDIDRAIADDPDSVSLPSDWMDNAMMLRPAVEKERITMRLDADMLAWFKRQGRGYQTRMNAVLRSYFEQQQER